MNEGEVLTPTDLPNIKDDVATDVQKIEACQSCKKNIKKIQFSCGHLLFCVMCTRDIYSVRGVPRCPTCRTPIEFIKLNHKKDYYFIFMAIQCFERALGSKHELNSHMKPFMDKLKKKQRARQTQEDEQWNAAYKHATFVNFKTRYEANVFDRFWGMQESYDR